MMLQQQINEVMDHPKVTDAIRDLSAAGYPRSLIFELINTSIAGITNEPTAVAVKIVSACILRKLRQIEKARQPKHWWGKLIKSIFG